MKNNTWVEINKENLIHNLRNIKSQTNNSKLMFVVKANAYGHDIKKAVSITEEQVGLVDTYGVHMLESAIKLRENGIKKDIYVLGYVNINNLKYLFEYNLIHVVTNKESLNKICELAKNRKENIKINLKCETGTNRQGILKEDFPAYLEKIKNCSYVKLEGLVSHFANIEDTTDKTYAKYQLNKYEEFINIAKNNNFELPRNHIACSAAILLLPETHYDMVRAGISSYGLWSSKETYLSHQFESQTPITLKPVLSWKTIIGQLKTIQPGSYIGYGCTYKTTNKTQLAILPIGYYDGYDRKLSNSGYVIINDKRAPLRGRVCMNMIIVDVTNIPEPKLEDEVILIGKSSSEEISAEEIADKTNTINYEVVSRINPNIERIIV
ncbi:MAG: alanine racemase [Candidatus Mcinerneyibacterium aminivorans]|uniref:Alanine racemase n=1 Tax=Candidatus Mcinerneyibacterium aminivorans TaxID=2703815 RepID=A0A5D0MCJ1_9BACT|nr:MAG: alanine racemase [Candidatus Mcinerneyibacterium aminivorans]